MMRSSSSGYSDDDSSPAQKVSELNNPESLAISELVAAFTSSSSRESRIGGLVPLLNTLEQNPAALTTKIDLLHSFLRVAASALVDVIAAGLQLNPTELTRKFVPSATVDIAGPYSW
jgi:hypothetical protein